MTPEQALHGYTLRDMEGRIARILGQAREAEAKVARIRALRDDMAQYPDLAPWVAEIDALLDETPAPPNLPNRSVRRER